MEKIGELTFFRSDLIGSGRFGWVFRGKLTDAVDVAVKRIEKRLVHVESKDYLMAHKHPNIIRYFATKHKDVEFL